MRTRMCHYRSLPYDSLSTTTHPSETASCSYLSDGTKITAKLTGEDETQYRGSVIYLKESSGFSLTFETVSMPGGGMVFVFQHDMDTICLREGHLGSVRTIVNASGTVVERNDYYPFGSRTTFDASYATLASNRQRFSGKEDQTAVAGSSLPYLDFGARMYDSKLVRWSTYDPMAEKYYGFNPYVYCAGNPVNRIVLFGSEWKTKEDKSIANNLSETFTERQRALTLEKSRKENRLNKLINAGSEDKKVRRLEETIQSIDMQMATLEDLSKGLSGIEASSTSYTFNTIDNGD